MSKKTSSSETDNQVIPTLENTMSFDMAEAMKRLQDPQIQADILAILNGEDDGE